MNWSEEQVREHEQRLKLPSIKESALAKDPQVKRVRMAGATTPWMNKTELRYSIYLQALKQAGEIADWRFQEWKFKLAPATHYTPDFAVLRRNSGTVGINVEWTLYDVKGRKAMANGSEGYWAEEDAKLKIKLCPRLWPWFRWCIVFPKSNGEWEEVEFHA